MLLRNIANALDSSRSVLSDKTILKYNKKGLLIENKLSEAQIQPNSIDLTLGPTWKRLKPNSSKFGCRCIDPMKEAAYDSGNFKTIDENGDPTKGYFILPPKSFVLMASNEILNIPNGILSFVQGRSSIARLAIQTEQAGLIDAGFRGTITFEIFNQSDNPIILYEGMRIAQVYFFKSQYADKVYSPSKGSKYKEQIEATGSKVHLDPEFINSNKQK